MSLEGTEDTPYIFLTPYETPYKVYLPSLIKKLNPLKHLAITHFTLYSMTELIDIDSNNYFLKLLKNIIFW